MRMRSFTDYWRRPVLPFLPFLPRFLVSRRETAASIEHSSGKGSSLIPRL
jgi:hypothetical protein